LSGNKSSPDKRDWANSYIDLVNKKVEHQLKEQEKKALSFIKSVEDILRKNTERHKDKLADIETMKEYVMKHKFLPKGYRKMLNSWKKRD